MSHENHSDESSDYTTSQPRVDAGQGQEEHTDERPADDRNGVSSTLGAPTSPADITDPRTGEILTPEDAATFESLPAGSALLFVVSGPDQGSRILLDQDTVSVGRSTGADIFLDDVTVSRKHAQFIRTADGYQLRDTGSLNGTYVGKERVDVHQLKAGDEVQIGKFRMIYHTSPRS
ncbi:FHA domain-containing protein [Saxibacter everestensis]|uniref:FHA domain-containing protein n=1 Tax=Saxibacter everestensis TaxID=2909229 RepID=A0ABY8QYM2_9MICO|nr:FHA domain-containing protein [Brevibacteriaceae bacterium ZFBP1038]